MVNPRPQGRAIVGVLIAAAIFTLIVVGQNTGGGAGAHHHVAFRPPHRHPEPPAQHHPPRHRHHGRRHEHHHHHHTATRAGLIASRCSYRDPAGGACGSVPPPGSCSLRDGGALQDPSCTPGAIDPRVTQSNVGSTICVSGYTSEVRPPYSYTAPLEDELIRSYGLSVSPAKTELDHLISLELGGAPADPRNLFPQPYSGRRGATDKDALENRLHSEVCAGSITLATAQHEILDWVKHQPPAPPPSPPPAPSTSASSGGGSNCDPNYSGACLDPNAPDYDCAGGGGDGPKYVQGPIRVVGTDHYGLDGNGDGVACE